MVTSLCALSSLISYHIIYFDNMAHHLLCMTPPLGLASVSYMILCSRELKRRECGWDIELKNVEGVLF
uniref:Uncharacterized protein n=1 Tax=Arundo donax TaxID=35708 RepID=A0A0A8Z0G6_ARUDO